MVTNKVVQGGSKKVSCCTVITAYFFLSHPVYVIFRQRVYRWEQPTGRQHRTTHSRSNTFYLSRFKVYH